MSDTDVVTISPLYRELLAEGFVQGEATGFEKGIETLLRVLTKRLGEVPPTLCERLHTIHDLDVLGQLTYVALDCQSLDEFEAALKK